MTDSRCGFISPKYRVGTPRFKLFSIISKGTFFVSGIKKYVTINVNIATVAYKLKVNENPTVLRMLRKVAATMKLASH